MAIKGIERAAWAAVVVGLGAYVARRAALEWAAGMRAHAFGEWVRKLQPVDGEGRPCAAMLDDEEEPAPKAVGQKPSEGDIKFVDGTMHILKWTEGADMTGPLPVRHGKPQTMQAAGEAMLASLLGQHGPKPVAPSSSGTDVTCTPESVDPDFAAKAKQAAAQIKRRATFARKRLEKAAAQLTGGDTPAAKPKPRKRKRNKNKAKAKAAKVV